MEGAGDAVAAPKAKAISTLSKKRYEQVVQVVARIAPARVQEFEREFKEIMCFDPSVSSSKPDASAKVLAWRRKKATELGTTTYVTSGRKRQYEAAKAKA